MIGRRSSPVFLCLIIAALGISACEPASQHSDSGMSDSLSASPPILRVDSARAAQLAADALRKESTGGVRVVEVKRDSVGYLVTLFSDPLVPGGGGRVRVAFSGKVTIVERFQ